MNIQSLRTFLIAGEHESMSAAAEQQLYAPSTVTTHIKQLEAEWGVALFRREGRGVQLTSEGRILLGKVKTIVQNLEQLTQTVDSIEAGGAGHMRLSAIEPAASYVIAPLLADYVRERPLLQINLEAGSYYSIVERYLNHQLELAIVQEMIRRTNNWEIEWEHLYTEKMRLLMRDDHPLAIHDSLTVEDIQQQRFIYTETVWSYRHWQEKRLNYYGGNNPHANLELNSIPAAIHFVQAGIGIALLPQIAITPLPTGTVAKRVQDYDFERRIGYLHWGNHLADEQAAVYEFLQHIKQRYQQMARLSTDG